MGSSPATGVPLGSARPTAVALPPRGRGTRQRRRANAAADTGGAADGRVRPGAPARRRGGGGGLSGDGRPLAAATPAAAAVPPQRAPRPTPRCADGRRPAPARGGPAARYARRRPVRARWRLRRRLRVGGGLCDAGAPAVAPPHRRAPPGHHHPPPPCARVLAQTAVAARPAPTRRLPRPARQQEQSPTRRVSRRRPTSPAPLLHAVPSRRAPRRRHRAFPAPPDALTHLWSPAAATATAGCAPWPSCPR